mmetsp:Transcript_3887/g.15832  ORF Transcript_3887/g.15832 Transcript_3887/m.15832 type:complete len:230 (-) Transcript_3887:101-790(-)
MTSEEKCISNWKIHAGIQPDPSYSRGNPLRHLPPRVVPRDRRVDAPLQVGYDGVVDEVDGVVQAREHRHRVVDIRREVHGDLAQDLSPARGRGPRGLQGAVHGEPHLAVDADLGGKPVDPEVLGGEPQLAVHGLQPERAEDGGAPLHEREREQLHLPGGVRELAAPRLIRECDADDPLAVADVRFERVRRVLVGDGQRHALARLPVLAHVAHDAHRRAAGGSRRWGGSR